MTKWIIGVVAILIIGAGAWWYFTQGPAAPTQGAAVESAAAAPAAPDTSDQSLVQDSANIDAQITQVDAQQ